MEARSVSSQKVSVFNRPRRSAGIVLIVLLGLGFIACGDTSNRKPLFDRLPARHTGVMFSNDLSPSENLNIVSCPYYYNGGGVAAGDVNGDGLVDLYFTANEGPNALYLNRGGFRFEEVTATAGVAGSSDWSNGVTMADVNGDGRLDIYVSVLHGAHGLEGHNELYINQGSTSSGVPRFKEQADAYGLDYRGYGTQALFFDYDQDGDLDAYLLNASEERRHPIPPGTVRKNKSSSAGDRLYRNEDSTFVDVTEEAGIYSSPTGAGLGVVASDFDGNGCPDLYVANDFFEHDYLYYNNCDGTFTEAIEKATRHVSYSSMGVDAADYNNDGRPDVAVLDMLPFRENILKTSETSDTEQMYRMRRRYGYHHQLDRNTLQLNQGNRRFSEIGLLAGIAATDWSWAPLFADLNNDGLKDLFVTNGIYRRPNDLDFVSYAAGRGKSKPWTELVSRMPQEPIANFAFQNDGDLTFSDSTNEWGLGRPGFSSGATYADLNNDGGLDLIVNNVNAPATIYKNRVDSLRDRHYLRVRLRGDGNNTHGLGAKVKIHQGKRTQLFEQMLTRGYKSSVDPRIHVGLGTRPVDSLVVTWPDGAVETRTQVPLDTTLTLRRADATAPAPTPDAEDSSLFSVATADTIGIDYRHEENTSFDDFQREPLMPRRISTEGPALAVGDVNGDGREDVFLGGAKRQPAALYLQGPDGRFRPSTATDSLWQADQLHEDVDATFFDANGDGHLDLYVVSAGNEFSAGSDALRDRLYVNDGTGAFRRARGALPEGMAVNGGGVAPGDFDGDGDTDLFVGGRSVPGRYGESPRSYLLENDGSGRFRDVTDEVAPGLRRVGMVTDATWADVRGSGAPDLVVVGEWMPITVFEQEGDRLVDRTEAAGLAGTTGWWNAVRATDLTGDGAPDLIAGNFGLNSRLQATPGRPVRLYLNDFNEDGRQDPILTRYSDGVSYPWIRRETLIRRFPSLKDKFPTYEAVGASQIDDIFPTSKVRRATTRIARTFGSAFIEHEDDGTFTVELLPNKSQFAPIYGILIRGFVGDEERDLMLGGNFHGVDPRQGRYDASMGTLLRNDGGVHFTPVPPPNSGIYLKGTVRAIQVVDRGSKGEVVLVARNDARPQILQSRDSGF
jgi:hypothetical protein